MENLRVQSRALLVSRQVAIVVSASLVIAVCARISLPLPFTPVPLTLANFAVLAVGLVLGSRRGFVAAALYLSYGAAGMPVFSPAGPGGMAHLLGPSGGYLLSYPLVAFVAGFIGSRLRRRISGESRGRRHCRSSVIRLWRHLDRGADARVTAASRCVRPVSLCVRRGDQGDGCRGRCDQVQA